MTDGPVIVLFIIIDLIVIIVQLDGNPVLLWPDIVDGIIVTHCCIVALWYCVVLLLLLMLLIPERIDPVMTLYDWRRRDDLVYCYLLCVASPVTH